MLFVGLLFFIFLVIIRPQDFVPGLVGSRVVFYTLGALSLGWLMSPLPKQVVRTVQDKFFLLFCVAVVLSTFPVMWITYTLETTIETTKLVLIYLFVATIVDSPKRFVMAIWAMVVLLTCVGLIAAMQFNGYDITGQGMIWSIDKQSWQIRGVGLFDNPNDIAYSVSFVVPFAIGQLFHTRSILRRLGAAFLLLGTIYVIFITKSRGGYLAVTAGGCAWVFFWFESYKIKKLMLVLGGALIFAVLVQMAGGYRGDNSSMGRVEAWNTGMNLLQRSPLIGVGKGQFIEYHERDTHNSFVRAGAELGFLGLYAFSGILIITFLTFLSKQCGHPDIPWKIYNLGFISYLVIFAVASLFSTRCYDMILLIIVGLSSARIRIAQGQKNSENEDVVAFPLGKIFDKKIFLATIGTVVVWKLFLIQVW